MVLCIKKKNFYCPFHLTTFGLMMMASVLEVVIPLVDLVVEMGSRCWQGLVYLRKELLSGDGEMQNPEMICRTLK